jgi:hypothetical protein
MLDSPSAAWHFLEGRTNPRHEEGANYMPKTTTLPILRPEKNALVMDWITKPLRVPRASEKSPERRQLYSTPKQPLLERPLG